MKVKVIAVAFDFVTVTVQVVNGYTIPVGHQVCVSPTTNHHLPDTWDEPELFKPDRYAVYAEIKVTLSRKCCRGCNHLTM